MRFDGMKSSAGYHLPDHCTTITLLAATQPQKRRGTHPLYPLGMSHVNLVSLTTRAVSGVNYHRTIDSSVTPLTKGLYEPCNQLPQMRKKRQKTYISFFPKAREARAMRVYSVIPPWTATRVAVALTLVPATGKGGEERTVVNPETVVFGVAETGFGLRTDA